MKWSLSALALIVSMCPSASAQPKVKEAPKGHSKEVTCVAYNRDGTRFATGSGDKTVKIWDTKTLKTLHTLKLTHPAFAAIFSPDGQTLATSEGTLGNFQVVLLKLWDVTSGKVRVALDLRYSLAISNFGLAFSPDGKTLVAGDSGNGMILRWDVQTGARLEPWQDRGLGASAAVAFSPEGQVFASGDESSWMRLWDAEKGRVKGKFLVYKDSPVGAIRSLIFSPDGKWLAARVKDTVLWDVAQSKEKVRLATGRGRVGLLAFSPDSKTLVVGVNDRNDRGLHFWDVESAQVRAKLDTEMVNMSSIAYHPSGAAIAVGHDDGSVKFWNPQAAK